MTNTKEDVLRNALLKLKERYEAGMQWSPEATSWEKGLVSGNLNGFCSFLAKEAIKELGKTIKDTTLS